MKTRRRIDRRPTELPSGLSRRQLREVGLQRIAVAICKEKGLDINDLKLTTRKREITEAKQLFFFFASTNNRLSWSKIGDYLGMDHATVIHGRNQMEAFWQLYDEFQSVILRIGHRILYKN